MWSAFACLNRNFRIIRSGVWLGRYRNCDWHEHGSCVPWYYFYPETAFAEMDEVSVNLRFALEKASGCDIMSDGQKVVAQKGGTSISLHAQCRVQKFYEKCGYTVFGEVGEEERCPHIWMSKQI